jgi:hypothetical protein
MKSYILAFALLAIPGTAFGQTIDCSAFRHEPDGSWQVIKPTSIKTENGVISLNTGRFHTNPNSSAKMAGVDVAAELDRQCR